MAAAEKRGLDVLALSRFSSRPLSRDGLLLGFAAIGAAEIRRGVKELAAALVTVSSSAERGDVSVPAFMISARSSGQAASKAASAVGEIAIVAVLGGEEVGDGGTIAVVGGWGKTMCEIRNERGTLQFYFWHSGDLGWVCQ